MRIWDSRSKMACWVDLFFRKPYWELVMRLFDSRCHMSRWFIIFSNSLPITLVREMGRYDWGSDGSEFGLRIGIMMAFFHGVGYIPERKISLKRSVRYDTECG